MLKNCSICGLPTSNVGHLDSNGICAYCASKECLREKVARKRAKDREGLPIQVREILTGKPSGDEIAASAAICEKLAIHLEANQNALAWKMKARNLRLAIAVLKTFLAVLFFVYCSNEVTEEPDAETEEPGSELITGFARFEEPEEPDAAIEETEEPDAAIEETEEPDAAIEEPDAETEKPEPDTGTVEEPDAAIEEPEEPDAAIEEPEEPDAAIEEPDAGGACELLGSWSITILPSVFCFDPSNNTFDLEITDCDQTLVLPIETSDPSYGDFNGSITFHVTREGESLTGSADIEGTVHVYGQDMPCTSVATISGGKDGTREHS